MINLLISLIGLIIYITGIVTLSQALQVEFGFLMMEISINFLLMYCGVMFILWSWSITELRKALTIMGLMTIGGGLFLIFNTGLMIPPIPPVDIKEIRIGFGMVVAGVMIFASPLLLFLTTEMENIKEQYKE